jgi:hypothetical protein
MDGNYSSVHATLGVRSDGSVVWVITYEGTCQPMFFSPEGPANGSPAPCDQAGRWQVDVGDSSGQAYAAFGYTYDGSAEESSLEMVHP